MGSSTKMLCWKQQFSENIPVGVFELEFTHPKTSNPALKLCWAASSDQSAFSSSWSLPLLLHRMRKWSSEWFNTTAEQLRYVKILVLECFLKFDYSVYLIMNIFWRGLMPKLRVKITEGIWRSDLFYSLLLKVKVKTKAYFRKLELDLHLLEHCFIFRVKCNRF